MNLSKTTRTCAIALLLGLATTSQLGCFGEAYSFLPVLSPFSAPTSCGANFLEAIESSMAFNLDTTTTNTLTGLTFTAGIPDPGVTPILKPYQIVITLPAAFTFLGFDALGAGAQVAKWEFEWFNPNDVFDPANIGFTITHYAIDANTAYSDSDSNSLYDPAIDPSAVHTLGSGGEHILTLTLPFGGTKNGDPTNCSYFATDVRFTLLNGLFQTPSTGGQYTAVINATSVDPDTGNEDNGTGTPPSTYTPSSPVTVTVPEPSLPWLLCTSLGVMVGLRSKRSKRG